MWFCRGAREDCKRGIFQDPRPCTNVLMEIVSARDLLHQKRLLDQEVDPYCIVRLDDEVIHRTSVVYNDPDPIWTVKTGSLCLLKIPKQNDSRGETNRTLQEITDESDASVVFVEVCHGKRCIGIVTVPCSQVLASKGERTEYPLVVKSRTGQSTDEQENRGTLALRFRLATDDDVAFMEELKPSHPHVHRIIEGASDINLKSIKKERSMFAQYAKRNADQTKMYLVQPYPDEERSKETKWMSKEGICNEALKPSKKWIEAGDGAVGRVFVEIIGCTGLPNMDIGVKDMTDPFVGLVFEDTMVRTDVIFDSLNPRWMPWCSRAFCFNIAHPTSMLLLGVFDFDAAPIKDHDPVGRVVINTANFQSDTSYLLHYTLHHDPRQDDNRGTIIIRLRVEWKSESDARKLALNTLPPRFLINVDNQKAFHVLRYICRGKADMEQPSIDSVKFYVNELMSYGLVVCYLIDVILGVLLWRGRASVSCCGLLPTMDIWFPIHSVALLAAAVVLVEAPSLAPAVLSFTIAYILLTINFYGSRYPYPWKRCKSWHETNIVLTLGRSVHPPVYIEPYEGVEEAASLDALDKVKAERVSGFLWDAKSVGLSVQRAYSKTSMKSIVIHTDEKQWALFASSLAPVHTLLCSVCTSLRMWRNFVNWRGFYAHKVVLMCLGFGSAWVFLPMNQILQWIARVLCWILLGPWMKLVDMYYVHPRYRTKEELLEDPSVKGTTLDSILTSEDLKNSLKNVGTSARLACEQELKLKDMREQKFGRLSQLVPRVDKSRYPHVPLPDSTAQPYGQEGGFVDISLEDQYWERVSGQKLEGDMIPKVTGT